jgi:hypothetical protein
VSTITSGVGGSTAPSRGYTLLCAIECECATNAILSPALGWWIARVGQEHWGVGGDQRGYDGGKKVKGTKRHLLVDTEGLVLKGKVHSAKVMDFERGSRSSSKTPRECSPASLSSVAGWWLARRGQGQGLGTEKTLGWSVDLVERPKKDAPKEVLMAWAREWAKEGVGGRLAETYAA